MSSIPHETPRAVTGALAEDASLRGADAVSSRVVIAAGAAVALAYGWVFWEFLRTQFRWAVREPSDWGHTLAIPLIAAWFIWLQRDRLARIAPRTTWFAFVPILAGIAWYALCVVGPQTLWHHNLRGAGAGLTLFGLVLLFFGWRAMAVLWFPVAYVVIFGQTVSERFMDILTQRLQDIAAAGSWVVLNLVGIDTDRSGNVLTVHAGGEPKPLNIAEACSGMRMLVAFLALGVAMAYTGLPRVWQRVLLVALGIPVALAVNILRVVTLGVLSMWDIEFAAGEFHNVIGLVWLVPAFLIYLGVLWILRNVVVEEPPARPA